MRTYPFRTPYVFTRLFSGSTWTVDPSKEKLLFLTFDDGPHPEVTPYVLDLLKRFDAKATFFVVGANVDKHPEVLKLIQSQGHQIGNHSYHHPSGWNTPRETYLRDVSSCQEALTRVLNNIPSKLFRPPYGRITPGQIRSLKRNHEIVMWSLLSGDFDPNLNIEASRYAMSRAKAGEIIVFHDSEKSLPNLKQLLPWFLECFHRKGYKFATLSPQK